MGPAPQTGRRDSRAKEAPSAGTLERLDARRVASQRYRIDGEIGRGGMGAILRVWDEDLRRHLAMKVILRDGSHAALADSQRLARFLEEAQITGQLDHPGIVPVHELGLDPNGQVFFTMHLVKGMHFGEMIARARKGDDGWSVTRALFHVHRVAEALAFAHERRVLHRDIKPSNLMVGRHGETYVMDWGLARLLDAPDTKSIQLAGEPAPTLIQSDRHTGGSHESLCTLDGDVVGTPAYMSPEQARGEIEHLGPTTDIYSLGAVLYELLAGHAPYGSSSGQKGAPRVVWRRVLEGPPAPLREVAPSAQPELVAIAERAMARSPDQRYASMQELANDLRAYLEGRVVRAYAVGPWVEFVKWVRRNRSTAVVAAALLLVALGSGFLVAATERARATERSAFLDRQELTALLAEVDDLWPLHPDRAEACRTWLDRADQLVSRWEHPVPAPALVGPGWEEHAAASQARQIAADLEYVTALRLGLPEFLESREGEVEADQRQREQAILAVEVARLDSEEKRLRGLLDVAVNQVVHGPGSDGHFAAQLALLGRRGSGAVADVEARLAAIAALASSAERYRDAWKSIAGPYGADSMYPGLVLRPQLGLVPLGINPSSGLLEFWVEASGSAPTRREDGSYEMAPEHGIVLVLLPAPRDAVAIPFRDGEDQVRLSSPYFLSRYELTIAQWRRLGAHTPNRRGAARVYAPSAMTDESHPVESVTWRDAASVLSRVGLRLPSEAEWLHGARAGSPGEHWFGGIEDAQRSENLMGQEWATHQVLAEALPYKDQFVVHAPVGRFASNRFGLHSVHGNVAEWTLDAYYAERSMYQSRVGPSQLPKGRARDERVVRGGSYASGLAGSGFSVRYPVRETAGLEDVGVRPARGLEP